MPAWPSAKFSMCAVPTLVTTPQSGAAMRASAAISPLWFMPISTTAISCSGSRRSSCSGRPKALLRLPCDLSTWNFVARAAATASLVVVLPAEPVMATTLRPHWRRTCVARDCKARSGSSAISNGTASAASGKVATRARETTAAAAPRARAAATKSWPSRRSPRTAKNRSPGSSGPRVDGVAGDRQGARVDK